MSKVGRSVEYTKFPPFYSYNNKRLPYAKMLNNLRIRESCHKSKSKFYPKISIKPSTSFESELYL